MCVDDAKNNDDPDKLHQWRFGSGVRDKEYQVGWWSFTDEVILPDFGIIRHEMRRPCILQRLLRKNFNTIRGFEHILHSGSQFITYTCDARIESLQQR